MRFTRPLDSILNTSVKIRILRFLCKTSAEWNGSQIAREIGATPAAAHTALRALRGEGLLDLRNMGKTHVYCLSESSFLASRLLRPLFKKENNILAAATGMIRRQLLSCKEKKAIVSVAVFGSVSVREENPASDIDLCVVVENAGAKAAIERLFGNIDAGFSKEFGNTVSPYINTRAEFKAKHKKGLAVVKNILESHRLIYGERLTNLI